MNGIVAVLGSSIERAPWGWALLVVVLLAIIRVWPILSLQAIEAKERLRGEKRSDLSDCQQRLIAVEEKMRQLELKLVGAVSAYRILDVEVEMRISDSIALQQARQVITTAFELAPEDIIPQHHARSRPTQGVGS